MGSTELGKAQEQADDKKEIRQRRYQCMVCLVVILAIAVFALVIVVVIINNKEEVITVDTNDGPKNEVCITSGCAKAAARILDSVDVTVDPCDDFYMHACGRWKKTHIIQEDRSSISTVGEVVERKEAVTKYLLEDTEDFKDIEAIQKIRDLYTACVNLTRLEELGESPAVEFLDMFGGWPVLGSNPGGNWVESDFDLVDLLVKLRQHYYAPIVSSYVYSDVKETTKNILYLDQPFIGLPGRNYYFDPTLQHMRDAYVNFATSVAELLGANRVDAHAEFEEMLQFETDLANITMKPEDRRDTEALYHKMTLGDLSTNLTEPSNTDPIQFKWMAYFEKMFAIEGLNMTVNSSEPVVVTAVPYYEKMSATLQKNSPRTITNYLMWRIFMDRITYLDSRFRDLHTEYLKVLYGVQTSRPRWEICVNEAQNRMGMALGHMFVKETFDKTAKATTLEMIGYVRQAFNELLLEADWMDDETRDLAKEKADAIKEWVGYPDFILDVDELNKLYENVTVDKDEHLQNDVRRLKLNAIIGLSQLREEFNKTKWTTPPTVVNAYYNRLLNRIIFPAGVLQAPLFDEEQPKSMNYGAIGFFIGHEITHGFDDEGRQYDKNGELKQWWNETVIDKFKAKAQCLIDQYSEYVVPEAGLNINGINTQGENIADNGGIKQSFRAYRKWVANQGKEEKKLPGLSYTPNQLFFVNYAQIWCTNVRPENVISRINTGQHSPRRFRVIGVLQNSADFQRAFNCPSTSFMNREDKCAVW